MARKGNMEALERYWRNRVAGEHDARPSDAEPMTNPESFGGEVVGSALGVGLAVVVFWGLCAVVTGLGAKQAQEPSQQKSLLRYNWRMGQQSDWGS